MKENPTRKESAAERRRRAFRSKEEEKTRKTPPIPMREMPNYVFYGGIPVRRNGH